MRGLMLPETMLVGEKPVALVALDSGEFISATWDDLYTNQRGQFYVEHDGMNVFVQLFNWQRIPVTAAC